MIPDLVFKILEHQYKGYTKFSNGEYVEEGYRPDFVLRKGNNYVILESENSSSRKTFVGGMIKAAHFLQTPRSGILVFILVPKKNTKASTIAKHLNPYFNWIKNKTNLKHVYVIESSMYYCNEKVMRLDCEEFIQSAFKV